MPPRIPMIGGMEDPVLRAIEDNARYRERIAYYEAREREERRQYEERNRGRESGFQIDVRVMEDPSRFGRSIDVRVRGEAIWRQTIHERDLQNATEHVIRDVSHDIAHRAAREIQQRIEREMMRAMYGGNGRIRDAAGHMGDALRGIVDRVEKPTAPKAIEWLKNIPAAITHPVNGLVANVLNCELKVWNEGENMGHCLGKSYMKRIIAGDYIVFHTDMPKSKHGITFGFRKIGGHGQLWQFDQCKGYKNNTKYNDRIEVQQLIALVQDTVNEFLTTQPEPKNETQKKHTIESPARKVGKIARMFREGRGLFDPAEAPSVLSAPNVMDS